MKSVSLSYRDDRSDKVYRVELVESGGGFVVNFAYGRRGSALTSGTKTSHPVAFHVAQTIFDRLVAEKMAKGYREGDAVEGHTVASSESTGILPQLLNPVTDQELETLLEAPEFLVQEKLDGKRLLLRKENGKVTGINRRGIECGLPENIVLDAQALHGDWLLDGELVGKVYHAFDLLELDGSYRRHPLRERLVVLLNLIAGAQVPWIRLVASYTGEAVKRRFMERSREDNLEGIVFKNMQAPYIPGRPNSGGAQFKFKFVETASVVVTALNGKRSVGIGVIDSDSLVLPCGNVTIPVDHEIPGIGDIVEVRYLYAFPESKALFQPVYLGLRDDIELKDCRIEQLKYKRAEELQAA
ncbi:MAG: WGR domain-containing protein [Proteobacteria bacterium]|nr:WGR domain-containing protein [Pseudomonadota bacterium]